MLHHFKRCERIHSREVVSTHLEYRTADGHAQYDALCESKLLLMLLKGPPMKRRVGDLNQQKSCVRFIPLNSRQ